MKNVLTTCAVLISFAAAAQPTIWGGAKVRLQQNDTSFISNLQAVKTWLSLSGGGTVSSVSVVSANGFSGTVANPTTTPAITLTTSITGMLKGNGTAISAGTSGTDYSGGTSALATGILKSTTITGALSIAVAGDFPTLNQNTTGSAATLTTPRSIYGNNFDGSAALAQIIASNFGGTGNGFTKFTGPATAEKIFTLPNASATILTDNAVVTVAQGGTGLSSVGSDVTLLGSNGSANIYYVPAITNISAAIGFSRATSTLNLNIPDADASFRGTVSTGTQTFAGAKTFSGALTVSGLATGNAGVIGVATSTQASVYANGVPARSYTAITSTTTLDHTYNLVGIGTLTADITINLPACNATNNLKYYTFTKLGSDAFAFIVDPATTETFTDNALTKTIYGQNNQFSCQCISASAKWNVGR